MNLTLNKTGKIILVASILVGLLFISLGVLKIMSDNDPENNVLRVNKADEEIQFQVKADKEYKVIFKPDAAGEYAIRINDATLNKISNYQGNPIDYDTASDESYDRSYTVYLVKGFEYSFYITSESKAIDLVFEEIPE